MLIYLVNEVCEFTRDELIEMLEEFIIEQRVDWNTIPCLYPYYSLHKNLTYKAVTIGKALGFTIIKLHD